MVTTSTAAEPSILNTLFNALYEEYDVKREGVHVSDITFCPRKTCYQKIDPLPLNNKQLNFFTSGKSIHAALESLVRKYPHRYEMEKEVKLDGIEAHIDIYDNELKMPIEAKSARSAKMDTPKAHYISQLEAYMAMTDSDTGLLLVQLLMHFEDRPFVEFVHHMTKEQRQKKLELMKADAVLLKEAIARKAPAMIRHIAYDENLNWLCKSCPYAVECEKLRVKERKGMFPK
jgi:CRISPR/Cas system-associated exonuclease Cas4 (RecB family)